MPSLRPALPALCLTLSLSLCLSLLTGLVHAQNGALIQKGQRVWQQRCTDCHALDTDETGPRHRGVFGRRAGSIKDYDYSRALKRSQVTWDAVSLDRWLTDPEKFIPGQNMDYRVRSQADRAAVIAYLQSLSAAGTPYPATPPVSSPPAQSSRAAPSTLRR
jgi:cytochrome c